MNVKWREERTYRDIFAKANKLINNAAQKNMHLKNKMSYAIL